jgi:hypothetical protein
MLDTRECGIQRKRIAQEQELGILTRGGKASTFV